MKQVISRCEIAGAVAAAALYDLRVNLFTFPGFPQIRVIEASDSEFTVFLSWAERDGKSNEIAFQISRKDAFAAAKKFKQSSAHDDALFESVQKALAELEGKAGQARRQS